MNATKFQNDMQNRTHDGKTLLRNAKIEMIAIIAFMVMLPLLACIFGQESSNGSGAQDEPVFKDEGQLIFVKHGTNKEIKLIQIEIADNVERRTQGLMWRKSMPEDDGMLFVFDAEEPLTFWMKNTYISLDMIFADKSGNIVSIYPEATPYSEAPIPSGGPAKYVVEVNGGFCAKYGISVKDKTIYER